MNIVIKKEDVIDIVSRSVAITDSYNNSNNLSYSGLTSLRAISLKLIGRTSGL